MFMIQFLQGVSKCMAPSNRYVGNSLWPCADMFAVFHFWRHNAAGLWRNYMQHWCISFSRLRIDRLTKLFRNNKRQLCTYTHRPGELELETSWKSRDWRRCEKSRYTSLTWPSQGLCIFSHPMGRPIRCFICSGEFNYTPAAAALVRERIRHSKFHWAAWEKER